MQRLTIIRNAGQIFSALICAGGGRSISADLIDRFWLAHAASIGRYYLV
jgi:hypothetical protein